MRRTGKTKQGLSDRRLYWRGPIIWAVVPGLDGKKVRRSTGCRDERAASARADEWERRAHDPVYATAAATTLGGCVIAYLADHDRRRSSEAYKSKVRQKIGHYVRLWGAEMPLSKVTAALVLEYVDARQKDGAKDITIKDELGHLGQALKLARHLGTFHLELDRVLPPFFTAGHTPRDRWPTPAEMTALVGVLTPEQGAHVVWILATGCRLSEAVRAQRGDVNWEARTVWIRGTKTDASEDVIPITRVNEPLLRWALERAPGREAVEPLLAPWPSINHSLEWACKRAGIAKLTPNDLRRGHAKWHRLAGVDPTGVSLLLRHTTDKLAQTTYARVRGAETAALIDAQIREVPMVGFLTAPKAETGVLPVYDTNRKNESEPAATEPSSSAIHAENKAPPIRFERTTFALGKRSDRSGPEAENERYRLSSPPGNVLAVYADRFGLRAAVEAFRVIEWGAA